MVGRNWQAKLWSRVKKRSSFIRDFSHTRGRSRIQRGNKVAFKVQMWGVTHFVPDDGWWWDTINLAFQSKCIPRPLVNGLAMDRGRVNDLWSNPCWRGRILAVGTRLFWHQDLRVHLVEQRLDLVALHEAVLAVLHNQVDLDGDAAEPVDALAFKDAWIGQSDALDFERSSVGSESIPHGMDELIVLVPLDDGLGIAHDWTDELDHVVLLGHVLFCVALFDHWRTWKQK